MDGIPQDRNFECTSYAVLACDCNAGAAVWEGLCGAGMELSLSHWSEMPLVMPSFSGFESSSSSSSCAQPGSEADRESGFSRETEPWLEDMNYDTMVWDPITRSYVPCGWLMLAWTDSHFPSRGGSDSSDVHTASRLLEALLEEPGDERKQKIEPLGNALSLFQANDFNADHAESSASAGSWSDDTEDFVCHIEDSNDSTQPGSEEAESQFESWDGQGSFSEEDPCLGIESGDSCESPGSRAPRVGLSIVASTREAPSGRALGRGTTGGAPDSGKTMMLRNIPNKCTHQMLIDRLNTDFRGQFDFVYLPIDFNTECNIGYSFINFRNTQAAKRFERMFDGLEVKIGFPGMNSQKVVEVSLARCQGFKENVERMQKSPVMSKLVERPEWMPVLLDKQGNTCPFPVVAEHDLKAATKGRPTYRHKQFGMGSKS